MSTVAETLQMSEFQARVMDVPEDVNLLLAGGRGGGKSYALALLILRHVAQYGAKSKVLYLRISDPALSDFKSSKDTRMYLIQGMLHLKTVELCKKLCKRRSVPRLL